MTNSRPNDSAPDSLTSPADMTGHFINRPIFQLQSLPIEYRWEVTRRHPYYDIWWKRARDYYRYHRGELDIEDVDSLRSRFAIIALQSIGVSGEPPDPSNEFSVLGAQDLNSAWLSGAVHPISIRGLAGLLIGNCTADTLKYLGTVLFEAAGDGLVADLPARQKKMLDLMLADITELDQYFDEPFVAVNPAASGRDVLKALEELMPQWKQRYGLAESRNRSGKYKEYLQVWDLREGWRLGNYDRSQEKMFKEIAKQLGKNANTIAKHYRRAFSLIVGHPYSPGLWYRLFGPIKLVKLMSGIRGVVSDHRPLKSPTPRPVPTTTLCGNQDTSDIDDFRKERSASSEVLLNSGNDLAAAQLYEDIVGLISLGRTDEEVRTELELTEDADELFTYVRGRI